MTDKKPAFPEMDPALNTGYSLSRDVFSTVQLDGDLLPESDPREKGQHWINLNLFLRKVGISTGGPKFFDDLNRD